MSRGTETNRGTKQTQCKESRAIQAPPIPSAGRRNRRQRQTLPLHMCGFINYNCKTLYTHRATTIRHLDDYDQTGHNGGGWDTLTAQTRPCRLYRGTEADLATSTIMMTLLDTETGTTTTATNVRNTLTRCPPRPRKHNTFHSLLVKPTEPINLTEDHTKHLCSQSNRADSTVHRRATPRSRPTRSSSTTVGSPKGSRHAPRSTMFAK